MKGKVIKCVKNRYSVLEKNKLYYCKLKNSLSMKKSEFSNPIAVGDIVEFTLIDNTEEGLISKIIERKNYVVRKSVNLSYKSQILASNIDYAFLIVTIKNPITTLLFIDRYLVTTNAYKIPTILIFNKIDNYTEEDKLLESEYKKIYTKIGVKCISISVLKNKNISSTTKYLYNNTVLFSGHSGVGKSSFINLLSPNLNLKTKKISEKHKQGIHTTTFSEMLILKDYNTSIIDSPGIKGFGLVDISKNKLASYFPEFKELSHLCKFKDCLHVNEPKCKVLEQLSEGKISKKRYFNYINMLEESIGYRKEKYNK